MQPEIAPIQFVIRRLDETLRAAEPDVSIRLLDTTELQTLGAVGGVSVVESKAQSETSVDVLVLKVEFPRRTTRHYVVAPISTTTMSDGDFVSVMARVVNLRAQLQESEQLEIWVVLIAPTGALERAEWLHAERQFEGNQAFARVVVWLPDADASKWERGVEDVLRQLFLEPLARAATGGGTDLSPIDAILAAGAEPSFEDAWRTILLEPSMSPSARAERLLEVGATPAQAGKTP